MILMFFALFFTWYSVEIAPQIVKDLGVNGWQYFAAVLAWLLTVLAAARVLLKAIPSLTFRVPLPEGLTVMVLGVIAFVLVLYRLIAVPAPAEAFGRGAGVYIALIATLAVALSGFLKNAEPH
jgi:hypothetical protein